MTWHVWLLRWEGGGHFAPATFPLGGVRGLTGLFLLRWGDCPQQANVPDSLASPLPCPGARSAHGLPAGASPEQVSFIRFCLLPSAERRAPNVSQRTPRFDCCFVAAVCGFSRSGKRWHGASAVCLRCVSFPCLLPPWVCLLAAELCPHVP